MPAYAHHGTLTANTVATVTLTAADTALEVVNRSGSAEIYFTIGSGDSAPPDPTVGGDDCYVVPAAIESYVVSGPRAHAMRETTVVKLISSGTPTYSVIGGQA